MNTTNLAIICASIIVAAYYGTKILDWYRKYRKDLYSNSNKNEFFADCYKLINKWSKRGEQDYCVGLHKIIASFNIPDENNEPETEYGKSVIESLKKNFLSEIRDTIEEL